MKHQLLGTLGLLGALSLLSIRSASASAETMGPDPPKSSPQPGAPTVGATMSSQPSCSTSGYAGGQVQVRVAGDRLEVLSKAAGADSVCASVKLPAQGRHAVVRSGVAYISLETPGLTIVDLADPAHPSVNRTVALNRAVVDMREMDDTLWTIDASGEVVKHEFKLLQPLKPSSPNIAEVGRSSNDRALIGRVVVRRDGSQVSGQLVELVPNERLRLLRADGRQVEIPFSDIVRIENGDASNLVRAIPKSSPVLADTNGSIRVHLRSERPVNFSIVDSEHPKAILLGGVQDHVFNLDVSPAVYRVSGKGMPKEDFRLIPATRILLEVRPGNSKLQVGGGVLLGTGILLAVFGSGGLFWTLVKAIVDEGDPNSAVGMARQQDRNRGYQGYGFMLGLGLAAAIAGPVMLGVGQTDVKISPDFPAVRLSWSAGLWLSPRGLVF
jgi:hypothetical protein